MPRGRSKAYANRTDLTGKVPVNAPTGMPYGENKKLRDSQKAVPVANPEVPKPVPSMPVSESAPAPMNMPSQPVVPLSEPTQFPNEPITTGVTELTQNVDPDIKKLKSYLPLFRQEAAAANTPVMFKDFVKWLDNL